MDNLIRPYRYFVQNQEAYCPKCGKSMGKEYAVKRKLCSGGLFKRCPKKEHFHHKCKECDGVWLEGTMETHQKEISYSIKTALEIAFKSDMTPEEIKTMIDNFIVSKVMES